MKSASSHKSGRRQRERGEGAHTSNFLGRKNSSFHLSTSTSARVTFRLFWRAPHLLVHNKRGGAHQPEQVRLQLPGHKVPQGSAQVLETSAPNPPAGRRYSAKVGARCGAGWWSASDRRTMVAQGAAMARCQDGGGGSNGFGPSPSGGQGGSRRRGGLVVVGAVGGRDGGRVRVGVVVRRLGVIDCGALADSCSMEAGQ